MPEEKNHDIERSYSKITSGTTHYISSNLKTMRSLFSYNSLFQHYLKQIKKKGVWVSESQK